MAQIPRVIKATRESRAFALATLVLSIPREPTRVLAVFPGLGEVGRVIHATRRWESEHFETFLVSGMNQSEATAERYDVARLRKPPFNLTREKGVYAQVEATHTPAQCAWIAERVEELEITSMTLVAPEFHVTRVFLTLLRHLNRVGVRIILIPDPVPCNPFRLIPETGKSAYDMISGEYQRIGQYREKGDVATEGELCEYIEWFHSSSRT